MSENFLTLTLPDGATKQVPAGTTGYEVAHAISPGLAKAAMCISVAEGCGCLHDQDLSVPLTADAKIAIQTVKTPEGLDAARHTLTAQCLARAVKELFPHAKLAIGPTINHGFYYDVDFGDKPLREEDLAAIEKRMKHIVKANNPVQRHELPVAEVRALFADEPYKLELIDDIEAAGNLLEGGKLSVYEQTIPGQASFWDLCVGPHAPKTGALPPFTITNLAGAYWRGDSNNKQLTRIYGLAFATKEELQNHLDMLEEARKRDHRKIGPFLDLFHLKDVAPGQVFWHAKGWSIYTELTHYMRQKLDAAGYKEVNTPKMVRTDLYKASGHWDNYFDDLFLVEDKDDNGKVKNTYSLKPMNCPCHVELFNFGEKSYRDLPIRMAEFGSCMRNEAHGALHGLMRVTGFVQDDAHIFCTEDQMMAESATFCKLLEEIYAELGFTDYFVKFSTRPEKSIGTDEIWEKAEASLAEACKNSGIDYVLSPGDGAFYGPKLEFVLRDCIGRDWQCGTLQVDFNTATRLGAQYTTESGEKVAPVMLHRAILGSLERFIGILIENYEGKFPTWLAPTQAVVIPITDDQNDYARALQKRLQESGIETATGGLRVGIDTASERMQKKILMAQQQKVPYMLVVGKQEAADGTIAIRLRDGTDLGAQTPEWLMERLKKEVNERMDVK